MNPFIDDDDEELPPPPDMSGFSFGGSNEDEDSLPSFSDSSDDDLPDDKPDDNALPDDDNLPLEDNFEQSNNFSNTDIDENYENDENYESYENDQQLEEYENYDDSSEDDYSTDLDEILKNVDDLTEFSESFENEIQETVDVDNIGDMDTGFDGEYDDYGSESVEVDDFASSLMRDNDDDEDYIIPIDEIISKAIDLGASDIHIVPENYITFRIQGDLVYEKSYGIISGDDTEKLHLDSRFISNQRRSEFMEKLELDESYVVREGPHKGRRVRLNVARVLGAPSMVMRIISDQIPSPQALGVEPLLLDWIHRNTGLILVNGPTGSGKSTTIYSLIKTIQKDQNKRIVTLEKPVEYQYPSNQNSLISQREIGGDARSFEAALDSAMRQDPDVIVVGEIRNTNEIENFLRAGETGHLAISSMHTISPANTINRIQQIFPGADARRVLGTLAESGIGFLNQVLIKNPATGKRFAIREILPIQDDAKTRQMILQGDAAGIIQHQRKEGRSLEQQIANYVKEGKIDKATGRSKTNDPLYFDSLF